MASAAYSEDLTCPVCRTVFADPVTLLCGHSFCRECIAGRPSPQCPQCETAVPTLCGLPTSVTLKRLAEKMKEENGRDRAEHEEKLKLFCVTDQQLACIICRDAETHDGHKFKPIKEAAASLRRELEGGMEGLRSDIVATESLAHTQRAEMTKTTEMSQQLATQIHRQFEEMHQFLRKREDEVKNELRCKEEDAVERMRESLDAMETALSQSRELEGELTSVLQIEDSEGLLRSWTEGNSRAAPGRLFRPRANDLEVVNTSLSLGPYESHLQFFVWREMLQVIQPRAELLSLTTNRADITVSDDGRSLFCTPKSEQAPSGHSSAFGTNVRSRRISAFVQTTTLSFGSTAGSAFNSGSTAGSSFNSGSTAGSSFNCGSTAGSSFNCGSTAGSLFNCGSTAGSAFNSGSTAGLSFNSGSTAGSSFNCGSTAGSLFNCGSTAGSAFNSGSTAGSSFNSGSTAGSSFNCGSTAGSLFNCGSTAGSAFNSGSTAGSAFNSGSTAGSLFNSGSTAGSGQTTASSIISHVFNEFTSGQHYWETEVGLRDYWALGIKDYFLNYDGQKYSTCSPKATTELALGARPRKIGIYLNCSSKKLSFYDADNMTHIATLSADLMSTPLSAQFNIRVAAPDRNPLTVCWY